MILLTLNFLPQSLKERRNQLLRRNKGTGAPEATETETEPIDAVETTTSKYTRRGKSKFKNRKEEKDAVDDQKVTERRPSLNGGARRSELPKRYVRRRPGGANATAVLSSSPRPFRVVGRRRPGSTTTSTSTTSTSTVSPSTQLTDLEPDDEEEVLQDVEENDYNEEPSSQPRVVPPKVQRRPLLTLKDEVGDQKPSATNEEENKRQSKKYNNNSKKNSLGQILKDLENDEVYETTERKTTADIDDISAETAVAIAAHQLLAAPIPIIPNYDEDTKPRTKTSPKTITNYEYTSPVYTEAYMDSRKTDYLSTTTVLPTRDYVQTSTGPAYSVSSIDFEAPKLTPTTSFAPKTTYSTNAFTTKVPLSSIESEPTITHVGLTGTRFPLANPKPTNEYSTKNADSAEYSDPTITPSTSFAIPESTFRTTYVKNSRTSVFAQPITSSELPSTRTASKPSYNVKQTRNGYKSSTQGVTGTSPTLSTTGRFVGLSPELIAVPVEDYAFSTDGYTGLSQEPAYFTREYLLESPVTKTYDDEYQYLSPVTTQQTTTRKLSRKKIYRKISTTQRPTTEAVQAVVTTPKPRRVSTAKPFSKIQKQVPNRTYRPILNYDYYDDGEEKVAEKYVEGTKVVLHAKGTIECLDIGNFPHPTSCKKFISCARMESGALLGWEYVCPKGLSFDPVGGICNWSAGLGCVEKEA